MNMVPHPRPGLRHDDCSWCGRSLRQVGLAPPARDCCVDQRREQAPRDSFQKCLRESVLPLAIADLKRQASLAKAVTKQLAC